MRGRLFERALEIERVQDTLQGLSYGAKLARLQMCYYCVGIQIMESFREMENTEVSPIEALLVSLEMFKNGEVEFFEEEDGTISAQLTLVARS